MRRERTRARGDQSVDHGVNAADPPQYRPELRRAAASTKGGNRRRDAEQVEDL